MQLSFIVCSMSAIAGPNKSETVFAYQMEAIDVSRSPIVFKKQYSSILHLKIKN